jgi:hypothetical protein
MRLADLRTAGVPLCRRSLRLLACDDDVTAGAFFSAWAHLPLVATPYATCMAGIPLGLVEEGSPSTFFVGHEASGVCLVDNTTFAVSKSWQLDSVPVFMSATGLLLQAGAHGGPTNAPTLCQQLPWTRVARPVTVPAQLR